ncbi:haloacid dehalogenase [Enterococcus saigonensis]|uniref:Haloacid dehalogenase n=1 Tax=Enterococcus saigonensis TaxID=1805431 RepID=A0A679IJU5_9ENTE|nr:HAD family hydrolase [Enterococcus saigonensis]BCA86422.1 haloacid dehalogenase [Enterococcus saigonensis]
MINAIVFDVDDTIYDQQQPFRNAVHRIIPLVEDDDMYDLYIRFRFHSDETFCKVTNGEWTLTYMRNYRIMESLKDLDYPQITEDTALEFQKIYEEELDNIVMHATVLETLNFLKSQDIPISIITNGPTDHQYKKVVQLNLNNWVKDNNVIISQATGFEKPDRRIFQLAEKEFNLTAEKTLYVGDSFENDVIGSKSAGWKSLWFNHRNRKIPKGKQAIHDIELTSFDQLAPTIKAIFAK